jgi:ketosteroid isomerase-like protein
MSEETYKWLEAYKDKEILALRDYYLENAVALLKLIAQRYCLRLAVDAFTWIAIDSRNTEIQAIPWNTRDTVWLVKCILLHARHQMMVRNPYNRAQTIAIKKTDQRQLKMCLRDLNIQKATDDNIQTILLDQPAAEPPSRDCEGNEK